MNRLLVWWGLLLLIGFLATHMLVFSYGSVYVVPLWIVIAALGAASCRCCCGRRKGVMARKRACPCCNGIWAAAIVEGLILTVAVAIGLLQFSMPYIPSIWLLVAGAAAVADSLTSRRAMELQLGIFWLFSAVLFPFLNNFQGSAYILGALVFGVPLMLAGIVKKG